MMKRIVRGFTFFFGIGFSVIAFLGIGDYISDVIICTDTNFSTEDYCKASKRDVRKVSEEFTAEMSGIKSQLYEIQIETARLVASGSTSKDSVNTAGVAVGQDELSHLANTTTAVDGDARKIDVNQEPVPDIPDIEVVFVEIATAMSRKTGSLGKRSVQIGLACAPKFPEISISEESLRIEDLEHDEVPYASAPVFAEEHLPKSRSLNFSDDEAKEIQKIYQNGCYKLTPGPDNPLVPEHRGDYCVVALAVSSNRRGSASITGTICKLQGKFRVEVQRGRRG